MLGLCSYAGSGRVFICKCMQKKKEMATKSFVMQFISAIKQKEKKGELNIANGICDSFSIHTAILLPPPPLCCYLVASVEMAHLSAPTIGYILNCSIMEVSKILFVGG